MIFIHFLTGLLTHMIRHSCEHYEYKINIVLLYGIFTVCSPLFTVIIMD